MTNDSSIMSEKYNYSFIIIIPLFMPRHAYFKTILELQNCLPDTTINVFYEIFHLKYVNFEIQTRILCATNILNMPHIYAELFQNPSIDDKI